MDALFGAGQSIHRADRARCSHCHRSGTGPSSSTRAAWARPWAPRSPPPTRRGLLGLHGLLQPRQGHGALPAAFGSRANFDGPRRHDSFGAAPDFDMGMGAKTLSSLSLSELDQMHDFE